MNPFVRWSIVVSGMLIFSGCGSSGTEKKPEADPSVRTTNVGIYPLAPDTLVQHTLLPVSAAAWREATLSFQEGGVVEEIFKDLDDEVAKGEALVRLDADLLEAARIEARAGLDFQRYNYERASQLYDDGSIPERELRAARFELKQAESRFKTLEERLENTVLRAPFPGRVAERLVEIGQLVQPGAPAFRLVQTGKMKARAWIPENQIVDFSRGKPVEVYFDAYPEETFSGRIGRIGPAGDSARRMFPLEIYLDNPDGRLRSGMIGRMRAVRRVYAGVIVVPREAVQERAEGPAVFVVSDDGVARLRAVEPGVSEGDFLIIEKGLEFGDRIVVKGGRDLIDGDRVRITEVVGR